MLHVIKLQSMLHMLSTFHIKLHYIGIEIEFYIRIIVKLIIIEFWEVIQVFPRTLKW